MKIRRTILAPVMVAVLSMATGGWFLQRGVGQERNLYANARLFEDVLRFVSETFVDQKDPGQLYQMAIDGMLEELGDPHTALMPAEDYERLRMATEGEYGGIGVQIDRRDSWITVISPLPGTPGERAGLRPGDRIISVEGESTADWDVDMAVQQLRGPAGEAVDIEVARAGVEHPLPVRIVREEIHIQAVPAAYMMENDVGYVELVSFSESATSELRQAIEELRAAGARGVILDLRRNGGGLLEQGVSVSDLFLSRGQTVVETKGRVDNQNMRAVARTADQFPGLPVVVLVEPQSASASEIVAGALQDHDRALVLGRTTYGKGSVQTLFPLGDEKWLKVTTARWYTPVGRSIQKPYGIDAHVVEEAAQSAAVPVPDSLRPEYETDGGRTVYGGGGIHPDLVIAPDTLNTTELAYRQATWGAAQFPAGQLTFAVDYIRENPSLQRGFEVTPPMRDAYYRALVASGVELDREIFDAASDWVDQEIGYQITHSKWGEEAARQRINAEDRQVRAAADLLRQATSPQSLFALAQRYAPGSQNAGTEVGATAVRR